MATKKQSKSTKKKTVSDSTTTVTRKAKNSSKVVKVDKKQKTTKKAPASDSKKKKSRRKIANPIVGLINYFKGAWYELTQVSWPTRKSTWGMTFAVIGYSAFFVVLILIADAGFNNLFDLILGK